MLVVYVVGIPLAATVLAAIPLAAVPRDWLVQISNSSITLQIGLVLTSWLLLATLPGKQNSRATFGDTCPDFDNFHGSLLEVVAFSSFAVGGIALASAVFSVHNRLAAPGRVLAGLATSALYLAIWVPLVFASLCGLS